MSEFKTLKDLVVKQKIEAVMEDTIKWGRIPMIRVNDGESLMQAQINHVVNIPDLRAEAVKWVKYWETREGNLSEKYGDSEKILFIKHFFNLTEEDLK